MRNRTAVQTWLMVFYGRKHFRKRPALGSESWISRAGVCPILRIDALQRQAFFRTLSMRSVSSMRKYVERRNRSVFSVAGTGRKGQKAAVLAFLFLCRYNDSDSRDELLQPFIGISGQDHPASSNSSPRALDSTRRLKSGGILYWALDRDLTHHRKLTDFGSYKKSMQLHAQWSFFAVYLFG